jgi:hypothetical protein
MTSNIYNVDKINFKDSNKKDLYNIVLNQSSILNKDLSKIRSQYRKYTKATLEKEILENAPSLSISLNNKINELIENKDYEQILNDIKDGKYLMTDKQAKYTFENMKNDANYIVKINIENDDEPKYLTANGTTADFFNFLFRFGFDNNELVKKDIDTGEYRLNGELVSSDSARLINVNNITNLSLSSASPNTGNRNGGFFPYINTSNLDLTKYQIYNQNEANDEKLKEHCLIHTLKQNNLNDVLINDLKFTFQTQEDIKKNDPKINELKLSFSSLTNFKKIHLKKISKILKKNISLHEYRIDDKINEIIYKYEGETVNNINIAIYKNHFFIFEQTNYSKYFIDNYEDLKNIENNFDIVGIKNGEYKYDSTKKINSLCLIKKLFNNGYFKKLDMSNFIETTKHEDLKNHVYLQNIEDEQQLTEQKSIKLKKDEDKNIFFTDTETFVYNDNENHKLFLMGISNMKNDEVEILNVMNDKYKNNKDGTSKEQLMIYESLKILTKNGKSDALCYFHNLKYDMTIIEKYLNVTDKCVKDNKIYSLKCVYKNKFVEFRDSYKIISSALSKFTDMFKLDKKFSKKEAIAYKYNTEENNNKKIHIDDYKKLLSDKDKIIFNEEIENEYTYDKEKKTFNPLNWYREYLKLDCLVLKYGLLKFNDIINEITDNKISLWDVLTISSLVDRYMYIMGVYDGVYEVKANLRDYISKAVFGGRVHVNEQYKKKIIEGMISDYDGVSYYPSAIVRLCREVGLPTGKCKLMNQQDIENWEDKIYSIMTIKITKVNKTQQMPFIALKNKGSTLYTNDAENQEMTIDSITLQDYIKFHKIEYEILYGVYWNEGKNKKMGDVMNKLFNKRLEAQKEKNDALSTILKLMLNSVYGKTLTKKTLTKITIIKDVKGSFNKYISNNFNTIKSYRNISNNIYEVEETTLDNSFNRGHIGCFILSMSKRITNEIFDIANDKNCPIYYTDTDSMHLNKNDIPIIEKEYYEKYKKILNGKNLEQFHDDFKLKNSVGEIYSSKSIFLGKKSYYDKLTSVDKDNNIIYGEHIRLKGITDAGLINESKKHGNKFEGMYEKLINEEIDFVLNPHNEETNESKVLFDFKNGSVKTKNIFIRKVKF